MAKSKGQMVNHLNFAVCHLPFEIALQRAEGERGAI
jgi:hypothetical protein